MAYDFSLKLPSNSPFALPISSMGCSSDVSVMDYRLHYIITTLHNILRPLTFYVHNDVENPIIGVDSPSA